MADNDVDIDLIMGDMDGDLDPNILSFQASAIIAVCAAVLIGNAFVCALNCFRPTITAFYLKFILLASVVNMLSAIICMPLVAAALLQGEWKYGYPLCKTTGVLCFSSMVLSMSFSTLAAIFKIGLFLRLSCSKLLCGVFVNRDFIIMTIIFLFLTVSQFVLFILIYNSNLSKAPFRVLCKYLNSPNLTGYRMFYLVYSTLLTLAVLILVVPFDEENEGPT